MAGGNGSRFVPTQSTSQRILVVLTALPLSLAIFAFVLQWRGGGLVDPVRIGQLAGDNSRLPGVHLDSPASPTGGHAVKASADCGGNQWYRTSTASFPHGLGWEYLVLNNANPKVWNLVNPSNVFSEALGEVSVSVRGSCYLTVTVCSHGLLYLFLIPTKGLTVNDIELLPSHGCMSCQRKLADTYAMLSPKVFDW